MTCLTVSCWGQVPAPPQEDRLARVEILTRGPLHEAFASTFSFDPAPGMVAPQEPPEAIEELPPEQKPEGNNVTWIPGYFAWDDERNDFVWVSGIWRALPPGRQWVSGYWRPVRDGAQWVSGYWASAEEEEIEYLPPPPRSLEEGPTTVAASTDSTWVPGSWVWHQARYVWRPGYWTTAHPSWDWIPAHYVWAPRGFVYVNGYYDYPAARRGLLFAPVYTNWNRYGQTRYSYSPSVAINTLSLVSQLFLRPSYGHYYFGDYYGSNYSTGGYMPWFTYHSSRRGYDAFYTRERWNHRGDRDWDRSLQASYDRRRQNENARPARTWAEQQARVSSGVSDRDLLVTTAINDLARNSNLPIRLNPVARDERQNMQRRAEEIQQFRRERLRIESAVTSANPNNRPNREDQTVPDARKTDTRTAKSEQPEKVKLPKSPVIARSSDQLRKDQSPNRTEVLRPDLSKEAETTESKGKTRGEPKSAKGDSRSSIEDSPPELPPAPVGREPETSKSSEKTSTDARDSTKGKGNRSDGKNAPKRQPNTSKSQPAVPADGESERGEASKDRTRQPANRPSDDPPSEKSADAAGPKGKGNPNKSDSDKGKSESQRSRRSTEGDEESRSDAGKSERSAKQPGRADTNRPRRDQQNRDAADANPGTARQTKQDATRDRSDSKAKRPAPPPTAKSPPPAPKTPDVKKETGKDQAKEKEKDGEK
jgi:hypothetical protein